MKRTIARTTAAISVCSLLAPAALAQNIPGTAQPGLAQKRLEIQQHRPEVGGDPIIAVPAESAKQIAGGVAFKLNDIQLEKATVYKAEDVKHLWSKKLGTKVTLSDLNQIAADVTSYYRNNGYILTRAI